MSFKEMLTCLLQSLNGHQTKIYKQEMKQKQALLKEDPEAVYKLIKDRLLEFKEGLTEKQTRVKAEWEVLTKGRLPALQ